MPLLPYPIAYVAMPDQVAFVQKLQRFFKVKPCRTHIAVLQMIFPSRSYELRAISANSAKSGIREKFVRLAHLKLRT